MQRPHGTSSNDVYPFDNTYCRIAIREGDLVPPSQEANL